eukprot:TRINITY_DN3715_c0_g1_i1.p1 TRINITY_DN3715_c0_g1~~TRINITY_DN3715_c0_g1_i1.p1  ORF type:complete len:274 (+),score=79.68 TRINITY_DN3715_c0_g1_i1:120-824(+)
MASDLGKEFFAGRKDMTEDVAKNWKLLLSYDEIQRSVEYCAKEINRRFEGQDIVVACILKGCVYFFVDLTRHLTIPYSTYFIEASSYLNEQTQSEEVELLSKLVPSKFKGKKVVLLDELYDNGKTLFQVKQKLLESGLGLKEEDVFTCTLLKKMKENPQYPLPDLVGVDTIPEVWLVGYGLDDRQEKRGWKHVFAIPKVDGIPTVEADKIFDDNEEGKEYLAKLRSDLVASIKD